MLASGQTLALANTATHTLKTQRPNLLVVSDSPFSRVQGLGVLLTNLLEGWPRESLALLHSAWSPTATMAKIGGRCRREAQFCAPGPGGRRDWIRYACGRLPTWRDRISRRWHERWLGDWRPDVVLAYLLDGQTLVHAAALARMFGVNWVAHITDDIQISPPFASMVAVSTALRGATARVAISGEMRQAYEARFGAPFHVYHNGADVQRPAAGSFPSAARSIPVVRYLGGVKSIQHGALYALAAIAPQAGFTLEIFGSWDDGLDRSFVDGDWIRYGGRVDDGEKWHELICTADFLLNPVAFEPEIAETIRFSFPTKLLEGLAASVPVIAFGPPDSSPVKFCLEHRVGWTVAEPTIAAFAAVMQHYRRDPESFRAKARADRDHVLQHFELGKIRTAYQRLLATAAHRGVEK